MPEHNKQFPEFKNKFKNDWNFKKEVRNFSFFPEYKNYSMKQKSKFHTVKNKKKSPCRAKFNNVQTQMSTCRRQVLGG